MSTWNNQNKSSASSWSNTSEASAPVWTTQVKGGQGWLYDQPGITYDGETDPASGNKVYYDSIGTLPVWTNVNKSA